jgi:hypothetical protein
MLRFRIQQEKLAKDSEHSAAASADLRLRRRSDDDSREVHSVRAFAECHPEMGPGITVTRIGKLGGEIVMK